MGVKDWFMQFVKAGVTKRVASPFNAPGSVRPVPKQAVFQDRTNLLETRAFDLSPEQRMMAGAIKRETLREYTNGMYALQGDLSTLFTNAIQDRRDYLENIEELRRYPIAGRILKIIAAEVLKPNEKGEIVDLVSDDEEVHKELQKFKKDHNIDNLLKMIIKDILSMGEYTLGVEVVPGQGVVAITDTIDQLSVISFYDRGTPSGYLRFRKNQFYVEPPENYCHFVIGAEKMRIALNDTLYRGYTIDFDALPDDLKKKIPEFVRVGEPIFYNVVEKIRQLQILEQVVIATKLAGITQRKIVLLAVPPSMPIEDVQEACAKFEETLNNQTGVDTDMDLVTSAEIIGQAGRYTVIPSYDDGKGRPEALDIRNDPQVDDVLNAITDYREVLLTSVGIPYKLVFGSRGGNESEDSRGDDIRVYAMFSNMIASIQSSVADGVIQLAIIHLMNKGFKVTYDQIDTVFLNGSVNVGDLERAEYDDTKQAMIANKIDLIEKMMENTLIGPNLNHDGVMEWLEMAFKDLTDGIPLFKEGITDWEVALHPTDSKNDQKRIEVLRKIRDNFRELQQQKIQQVNPNEINAAPLSPKKRVIRNKKKKLLLSKMRDKFRDNRKGRDSSSENDNQQIQ